MAVAPVPYFTEDFVLDLDGVLYSIAEDLQLAPSRYDKAVERYMAVNRYLEAEGSPFIAFKPTIYGQGSMVLNTTVRPILGPHDLDFVLELARNYLGVNPMELIRLLYDYMLASEIYKPMTELKNRCVRLVYADEFYMDILPACQNGDVPGTCIKVPDRQLKKFKDSNPKGYAEWFLKRCTIRAYSMKIMEKADPIPDQQPLGEKSPLQIVVQLLKRWRDVLYANTGLGPISIVLTTMAGNHYSGQLSASQTLLAILGGMVADIDAADRRGDRVRVHNPSNLAEDLSERWDAQPEAYRAFKTGIREFEKQWRRLMEDKGNISKELEKLFGEPVKVAFEKRAKRLQEQRTRKAIGVTSSGLIVPASGSIAPVPSNTFYGEE